MRASEPTLPFFFLVYEEEEGPRMPPGMWVARSVGTGHLVMGSSRERAIQGLAKTLVASIEIAARQGDRPDEWLARQSPDDESFVARFLQDVHHGVMSLPISEGAYALVPAAA